MQTLISLCLALLLSLTPPSTAHNSQPSVITLPLPSGRKPPLPGPITIPEPADPEWAADSSDPQAIPAIPADRADQAAPADRADPTPSSIIHFSKQLYTYPATQNATALADHFRPAFDTLNRDGALGDSLKIIYDMRLMDLQASIRHARKMKRVIGILAE